MEHTFDSTSDRAAACPACGARDTTPLYRNLLDITFHSSLRLWNVDICRTCASAFLNPRPTPEQLAEAYRHYYTHDLPDVSTEPAPTSWAQSLSRGYRDARFLGKRSWRASLGGAAPPLRQRVGLRNRYLPRAKPGSTLLDVGCGSGSFLHLANALGWEAKGIDSDPRAVESGRQRGFNISTCSLETLLTRRVRFDAITLSEVIEHVADPHDKLRQLHDLLRPGGFLFLSTPNATGGGHRRFRSLWRGLEVPRHIVVFSCGALCAAVRRAGFEQVRLHRNLEADWKLYMQSWLLSQGDVYQDIRTIPRTARLRLLTQSLTDSGEPDRLILTARRPKSYERDARR